MADTLDPYILFQGAGGVNPTQNAATQVSLSRLAMDQKSRAIQDAQAQVTLQQAQRAQKWQDFLAQQFKDEYARQKSMEPKPLTPGDVAAQGGSAATPTPVDASGTPQLARPADETDTRTSGQTGIPPDAGTPVPVSATTSAPDRIGIAGAGGPPMNRAAATLTGSALPLDRWLPAGQLYSQPAQVPSSGAQPLSEGTWDDNSAPGASENGEIADTDRAQPISGMAAPPAAVPSAPAAKPAGQPPTRPVSPMTAIDWAPRIVNNALAAGYGPEALAFEAAVNKHVNDIRKANSDRSEGEMKAEIARHKQGSEDLANFIATTPVALQEQLWPGFISGQIRKQHLLPEEAADYQRFPGSDKLPMLHTMWRGTTQVAEDSLHQNQAREAQARADELASPETKAKRIADSYKAIAEMDEKRRENVANVLSQAARQGPQQYAAAYAKIPDDIRPNFPTPDKYDPENTPDEVMLAGLTNAQKAAWFERQTTMANTKSNQALLRQQAQENYALHASEFAFRKAEGTKQDKAALHQAETEIEKLWGEERNLYPTIGALRTQIQNAAAGKSYINIGATGGATGYALSGKTPTLDAMKERYADLQEKAAEIIGNKYDVLDKVGGTPKVSREEALANLHTPTKNPPLPPVAASPATPTAPLAAPPAATPPPPQKQAKSLTTDLAKSYLQKAGGDKKRATALAKADGYTQ